jgi:uncharacterized protein (TIGR02246 family)
MHTWKSRVLLALLLVLPATAVLAQGTDGEEAAIQAVGERWTKAWDAGDVAAVTALYAADADYVDVYGRRAVGRPAIQTALAELTAGPYHGSHLELETVSTRFITPTLVVGDSRWELTLVPATEGEAPPTKGLSTVVFVKQGLDWKIVAHRTRVPYPPSPPAGK